MMCFINMNVWIKVISITAVNSLSWVPRLVCFTKRGRKPGGSATAVMESKLGQWLPGVRWWPSMVDGISMAVLPECDPWASNITPMSSLFKKQNLTLTCWIKISRKEVSSVQWFLCMLTLRNTGLWSWKTLLTHRLHVHRPIQIQTYTKPHGKLRRQRNMQRWKDGSDNIPSVECMEGLPWSKACLCRNATALYLVI